MIQWTCPICGLGPIPMRPEELPVHHQCGESRPDHAALVAALPESDRLLLGDRIEQLAKAIGIPTCGGCEARKQWLNRAHAWLIGE